MSENNKNTANPDSPSKGAFSLEEYLTRPDRTPAAGESLLPDINFHAQEDVSDAVIEVREPAGQSFEDVDGEDVLTGTPGREDIEEEATSVVENLTTSELDAIAARTAMKAIEEIDDEPMLFSEQFQSRPIEGPGSYTAEQQAEATRFYFDNLPEEAALKEVDKPAFESISPSRWAASSADGFFEEANGNPEIPGEGVSDMAEKIAVVAEPAASDALADADIIAEPLDEPETLQAVQPDPLDVLDESRVYTVDIYRDAEVNAKRIMDSMEAEAGEVESLDAAALKVSAASRVLETLEPRQAEKVSDGAEVYHDNSDDTFFLQDALDEQLEVEDINENLKPTFSEAVSEIREDVRETAASTRDKLSGTHVAIAAGAAGIGTAATGAVVNAREDIREHLESAGEHLSDSREHVFIDDTLPDITEITPEKTTSPLDGLGKRFSVGAARIPSSDFVEDNSVGETADTIEGEIVGFSARIDDEVGEISEAIAHEADDMEKLPEEAAGYIDETLDTVSGKFEAAGAAIATGAGIAGVAVATRAHDTKEKISDVLEDAKETLSADRADIIDDISGRTEMLPDDAGNLMTDVIESVSETGESLVEKAEDAGEGVSDAAREARDDAVEVAGDIADGASDKADALGDTAHDMKDGLVEAVFEVRDDIAVGAGSVKDKISDAAEDVSGFAGDVADGAEDIAGAASMKAKAAGVGIAGAMGAAGAAMAAKAGDIKDGAVDFAGDVRDGIGDGIEDWMDKTEDLTGTAGNDVSAGLAGAAAGVGAVGAGIGENIGELADGAAGAMSDVKDGIAGTAGSVADGAGDIVDGAGDVLSDAGFAAKAAGAGIATGAAGLASGAASKIGDAFDGPDEYSEQSDGFNGGAGTSSPSAFEPGLGHVAGAGVSTVAPGYDGGGIEPPDERDNEKKGKAWWIILLVALLAVIALIIFALMMPSCSSQDNGNANGNTDTAAYSNGEEPADGEDEEMDDISEQNGAETEDTLDLDNLSSDADENATGEESDGSDGSSELDSPSNAEDISDADDGDDIIAGTDDGTDEDAGAVDEADLSGLSQALGDDMHVVDLKSRLSEGTAGERAVALYEEAVEKARGYLTNKNCTASEAAQLADSLDLFQAWADSATEQAGAGASGVNLGSWSANGYLVAINIKSKQGPVHGWFGGADSTPDASTSLFDVEDTGEYIGTRSAFEKFAYSEMKENKYFNTDLDGVAGADPWVEAKPLPQVHLLGNDKQYFVDRVLLLPDDSPEILKFKPESPDPDASITLWSPMGSETFKPSEDGTITVKNADKYMVIGVICSHDWKITW